MNDICIITCIYNPTDSLDRINNFKKFYEFVGRYGLMDDFYICEVLKTGQSSIIPESHTNVLKLTSDSILWHKESALNCVLKILPDKYKKVIIMDADIVYNNNDWWKKIDEMLETNVAVQGFSTIKYCSYLDIGRGDIKKGSVYDYFSTTKVNITQGSSGGVMAYNLNYLKYMDGLYDKCIIGGGDSVNLVPFGKYVIRRTTFTCVCKDLHQELLSYFFKAMDFLDVEGKQKSVIAYLDETPRHLFHGTLINRDYANRRDIIKDSNFYPNLVRMPNGLWDYREDCDIQLKTSIQNYFIERRENLKSYIVSRSELYDVEGEDENKFRWVPEKLELVFFNVNRVRMYFEKNYVNINIIEVYIDNKPESYYFENDKMVVEMTEPKELRIYSEYFIPKIVEPPSNDNRKLSYMLKKIEIFEDDKWVDFSIKNIIV